MEKPILKTVERINELAKRLSECPEITRYDSGEDKEAWALADGFSDLEEAFRTFLDEYLPKLADPQVRGEALVEVLQDIGEEFRTILWHIQEPKFYSYLHGDSGAESPANGSKPKG
jgi:hypothetical protein